MRPFSDNDSARHLPRSSRSLWDMTPRARTRRAHIGCPLRPTPVLRPCTPFRRTREAYASTPFGLPLTMISCAMAPAHIDPPDSRMPSASTSEDDEEFASLLAFAKALSRRPHPEMADWYLKFKRLMVRGLQSSPCAPLN